MSNEITAVDRLPTLSTTDRGGRMTTLEPGRPVGRLGAAVILRIVLGWATWAIVSFVMSAALFGLAPGSEVGRVLGSPWAAVAALALGWFAILQSIWVYERAKASFGQTRVAGLLAWLTVSAGLAAGTAGWLAASLRTDPEPPFDLERIATAPDIPRELSALIGAVYAVWALVILCRLPGAIHHARSRQRTLERLRANGRRHAAVLTDVTFGNHWVGSQPQFTIEATYDADGAQRLARARMRADADRVPVVGTRMVVLTDGEGSVALEFDESAEIAFQPEERYRAPED
ncbi:hypothetical protein ABIQ69_14955 [Agromyces sp. G08B096]|uniref:Uncharacterized protein n=1 Tax=Agromyces sp. G08B096 TaxID=3156399 RepID=A0AAU7W656_9MICO